MFSRLFWKNKECLTPRECEVWDRWLRGQSFKEIAKVLRRLKKPYNLGISSSRVGGIWRQAQIKLWRSYFSGVKNGDKAEIERLKELLLK